MDDLPIKYRITGDKNEKSVGVYHHCFFHV
jgi:hypothetical protein